MIWGDNDTMRSKNGILAGFRARSYSASRLGVAEMCSHHCRLPVVRSHEQRLRLRIAGHSQAISPKEESEARNPKVDSVDPPSRLVSSVRGGFKTRRPWVSLRRKTHENSHFANMRAMS